jgi:hypothetical protein
VPTAVFCARNWFKTIVTAIPFACALGLFVDWQHDNAILRQHAATITKNLLTDSARIRAINDWVYHQQGFGKNAAGFARAGSLDNADRFFIVPALGPTPIQVLESGGDCAEKSRLVAAMLNELNIEAGLVMISPCLHCQFIHTVVEARQERGRMVVDPTWNVDYPAADGGYLGVRDLAGTNFGRERVAELQSQRGAADKISGMPGSEATFDYAVAINWDKNAVTAAVAATLTILDYAPESMFRPRFLEDPKLTLILFCVWIGIGVIAGRLLIGIGSGFARMMIPRGRFGFAAPK